MTHILAAPSIALMLLLARPGLAAEAIEQTAERTKNAGKMEAVETKCRRTHRVDIHGKNSGVPGSG